MGKTPLCDVCYKGQADGLELVHIGDSAPRAPVYRCRAHARVPYSPPIDIEATIVLDSIPSGSPLSSPLPT